LPAEFWQLSNLQSLNLFNNNLLELSPQIGQFRPLRWLGLGGHNNLTSVPPELGNLTSLDEMYLNGNKLTSLPAEVDQLRQRGVNIYLEEGIVVAPPTAGTSLTQATPSPTPSSGSP